MADDKIVKIYDISTIGSDEVLNDLEAINKQFIEIKKNKLSLNGLKAGIDDPEELKKIDKELANLLLKEKQLATELKQKQIQMKEYQLIAAAEREAKKKEAAGNTALAGSYNEINKKYKELLALSKNSTNLLNPQEVAQAQAELKKYKDLLDNFNRGLTKDGTLVGEYTTGILKAFKNSGLDDVINEQLKKAKQNVVDLDKEFEKLKQELRNVHATGNGSLQQIEQQLIENRRAAQGFTDQINRVEGELRSMNSTGSNISKTIGLQFKNLKKDVVQFALGYASFQGLLQAGQTIVKQSVALDSLAKSLEFVSGSTEEFAKNQEYLKELSDRLGVSLLDTSVAFKSFYAASTLAGISSSETRNIFEAATEASTVLKLTQEDTNGVLLAFGQIASKGKVQAEELRGQIAERLPGAFAIAAKSMGVTQAELNKMLEQGQVASNVFLPKFAEELKKTFSLGGKEATGLQSTIGRVQTAITDFVNKNQESISRSIDNIGKLSIVLLTVAQAITAIPFPVFIAGITTSILLTNTWVGAKLRLVAAWALEKGALIIENAQLVINNAIKTTAIVVTTAYTAATMRMATATGIAATAIRVLSAAFAFLTSPIGIVMGLTAALVTVLGVIASRADSASEAVTYLNQRIKDNAIATRVQSEANEKVNASIKDTIALLKSKLDIAKNEKISMDSRKKAVEDIIAADKNFFKGLTLQNIATKQSIDLIQAYITKLYDKAKAEAYAQLITEKQKKALEITIKKDLLYAEYGNDSGGITDNRKATVGNVMKTLFNGVFGRESENPIDAMNKLNAELSKTNEELDYLNKLAEKNKDIQDTLLNQNGNGTVGAMVGTPPTKDKKNGKEANRVEALKKEYESDKALLETQLNDKKITEQKYYDDLILLADKYRFAKLTAITKMNAEELQAQKQFNKDLSKDKADSLQKQYEEELKYIEKQQKDKSNELKNQLNNIEKDRGLSELEKITKKIEIDKQLVDLQITYNSDIDALEQKYEIKSIENANDRANALKLIQEQLGEDLLTEQTETFEKLQEDQKQALRAIQQQATNKLISVFTNPNLSSTQKQQQVKAIDEDSENEMNDLRLKHIDIELQQNQKLYEQKILTQKEYNDRVAELEEEKLNIYRKTYDKEQKDAEENEARKNKLIQDAKDAAMRIAQKYIDNYISMQYQEVEAHYKANQSKLDAEKKRRLENAQSKAEEEAINKEYEQKEREAERERNKERQEIARQQLAIEFAVASIKAISTSTNIYEGLIKEAVVVAEYFAALSVLNKQQFAFGGQVKPYNLTSGLINETPNITPTAYGDNVLAYVKPGEVILNQEQQARLGGARTFASIGVPGFSSLSSYGSSVQPPIFRSYYQSSTSNAMANEESMQRMEIMIIELTDIIKYESYKPVILNPNAVTSHQNKVAKNINLATV